MKMALFRCCTTSLNLRQYETSSNAVLGALGIQFVDVSEFGCCGYPLRNAHFKASVLASARNLAVARERDLDVLTICNCCYGSLKHAAHVLEGDPALKEEMDATLKREGLRIDGAQRVKHLMEVLHDDIGPKAIRKALKKTVKGLKIAVHEGCHLLRPSRVLHFDDPLAPKKFEELVRLTGAETVPWSAKLDCCGSPLMGVHDELSMDLTEKKLLSAQKAGADAVCVSCPFCHVQFDTVQRMMHAQRGENCRIPSILYPQLLGLCLGIESETLGMELNHIPLAIHRFLH